jgi:hypothetical protein
LLRSKTAHLYELHHLLTALVALSTSSPSITSAYIPYHREEARGAPESEEHMLKGLPEGFTPVKIGSRTSESSTEERDVVRLALSCLREVGSMIGSSF